MIKADNLGEGSDVETNDSPPQLKGISTLDDNNISVMNIN